MSSRGREYWVATVAEFERSGLTQAAFAQRRGLGLATLRSWIYKLRRERAASVSFVPVRVIASTAPTARGGEAAAAGVPTLEVELRSGVRLRLASGTDIEYVAALAARLS